jgi:hypothetical protein
MNDDVQRDLEKVRKELARIEARRTQLLAELMALSQRRDEEQATPHWIKVFKQLTLCDDLVRYEQILSGHKQPPRSGRSVDPVVQFRNQRIAAHSFLVELEAMPTEAAVGAMIKLYDVSRSTVFAAREQWRQLRKQYADQMSPEQRRLEIESLERACQSK